MVSSRILLGVGVAAGVVGISAGGEAGVPAAELPADTLLAPASSDFLALLPEGREKRDFILDCTGCHVLDAGIAFPEGQPRSRDSWRDAVERMLAFAGPASGFPVIGHGREAEATADWLAGHLRTGPPAARAEAPAPEVREYAYPYPGDLPHDLVVDGRGQVVITGMFTHRMLVLSPETGEISEVSIPVPQANPRAVDIGEDGDWWVLLGGPMQIARYRAAQGEWDVHDVGMYPHSIRALDGRIWFNGHFTADPPIAGYVDAVTGEVRTFPLTTEPAAETPGPIPYGLRVDGDGIAWMTELHGNRLVRIDPATGDSKAWLLPSAASGPRRPDIDRNGVIWIPEYSGNRLARFDPRTETFREFELPIADALPYVVRIDQRRGTIWIGTAAADAILSFDPVREDFTVYRLPTRGALVRHIDIDVRTGDVWAAYGASPGIPAKIARLRVTTP